MVAKPADEKSTSHSSAGTLVKLGAIHVELAERKGFAATSLDGDGVMAAMQLMGRNLFDASPACAVCLAGHAAADPDTDKIIHEALHRRSHDRSPRELTARRDKVGGSIDSQSAILAELAGQVKFPGSSRNSQAVPRLLLPGPGLYSCRHSCRRRVRANGESTPVRQDTGHGGDRAVAAGIT